MTINGTDVSAFQPGQPNFGTNRFGWVKVTEGVGWESPVWRQQIQKLRDLHDGAGYYHLCNGLNAPAAEAEYFWGVMGGTWQVGEPIAIDAEPEFYARLGDPVGWLLGCAAEIYRLSGLKAVLYSDWDHLKNHGYNFQPLVDYNMGLWGAAYNPSGYGDPSPWPSIFCWQDSDRDESSGGDDDVVYGDLTTWRAYGTPSTSQDSSTVTPIGDDVSYSQWTPEDKAALLKDVYNAVWTGGAGFPLIQNDRLGRGEWPATLLGANEKRIRDEILAPALAGVNAHTDADVKAISVTLTDAQIQTLAADVAAKLPAGATKDDIAAAVLAAIRAQANK